jgi:hypothetical protein
MKERNSREEEGGVTGGKNIRVREGAAGAGPEMPATTTVLESNRHKTVDTRTTFP